MFAGSCGVNAPTTADFHYQEFDDWLAKFLEVSERPLATGSSQLQLTTAQDAEGGLPDFPAFSHGTRMRFLCGAMDEMCLEENEERLGLELMSHELS